ncbi:hypothetical protein BHM03_00034701, partial [Ensete ventricosum]
MIDFDRRRPISGSIDQGIKKKREKKRKNLESGTLPIPSPMRSIAHKRFIPSRAGRRKA